MQPRGSGSSGTNDYVLDTNALLALLGDEPTADRDGALLVTAKADLALTLAAAHLKAIFPIAHADCCAAALAQSRRAIVVTGDPELRNILPESNVRVEWLSQDPRGA